MNIPFAWQQFLDFFGTLAFTVSFSLVIMSRITVSASSALPRQQITRSGPGTKGRRQALAELMGYMEKRLDRMRYGQWLEQDLMIATGQVEGTVRHLVGERFDCAGMRWRREKAEALLHLRCIELNGDWQHFFAWTHIPEKWELWRCYATSSICGQCWTQSGMTYWAISDLNPAELPQFVHQVQEKAR